MNVLIVYKDRRENCRKAVAALGFASLYLAACSPGPKPDLRIIETKVTVTAPCVDKAHDPGKPPVYADDGPKAPDAVGRFKQTAQANQERKARLAVLEPVLAACR